MLYRILFLALLLIIPAKASAWWEYGHHSVARIAALEVKPSTSAAIQRLIAASGQLETPDCPIRDIADAAYWPDCVKGLGERFSYAASWHYQNVDICKRFDQKSACRDGNCVSAQIERNTKLLGDEKVPVRERVMALAFLAHFVGDLHQPLHAGDRGDLGGNRFGANYGVIAGRTNLHGIWDGYLADRGISQPEPEARGILAELSAEDRAAMPGGSVEDWARESWAVSREFAYGSMMADPCAAAPTERPTVTEEMTRRLVPVIRKQVARGGLRLARLLDQALG